MYDSTHKGQPTFLRGVCLLEGGEVGGPSQLTEKPKTGTFPNLYPPLQKEKGWEMLGSTIVWTSYKNLQGARRSDGFALRRACNWFPDCFPEKERYPGWDVCRGHTILGSFQAANLTEAVSKADTIFIPGEPRPLKRIYIVGCTSCNKRSPTFVSYPKPWDAFIKCGFCNEKISVVLGFLDPARQLEVLPGQVESTYLTGSI